MAHFNACHKTWRDGAEPERAPAPPAAAPAAAAPAWLRQPTPSAAEAAERADASPPRLADAPMRRRGALVRALLQRLPAIEREARAAAGMAQLRALAPGLDGPAAGDPVRAALDLIARTDLAPLFATDARADVSVSGRVAVRGAERAVHGRVDRIAVDDRTVRIADIRTGRPPGDGDAVDPADVAGIALCAHLLARIYPDRTVVPTLVWTAGPVIRTVSAGEVGAALDRLAAVV